MKLFLLVYSLKGQLYCSVLPTEFTGIYFTRPWFKLYMHDFFTEKMGQNIHVHVVPADKEFGVMPRSACGCN